MKKYFSPSRSAGAELAEPLSVPRHLVLQAYADVGDSKYKELPATAKLQAITNTDSVEFPVQKVLSNPLQRTDDGLVYSYLQRGDTAIMSVKGAMVSDAVYAWWDGGTCTRTLSLAILHAQEHGAKNLTFLIDSPGGETDGVPELARLIYNKRKELNMTAIARKAFSAAFYVATACNNFYLSDTGGTGAMGVYAFAINFDKDEYMAVIVNDDSPKKVPTAKNKYASIQDDVNFIGKMFISDVAKFRGKKFNYVKGNFGKGSILTPATALRVGAIDGLYVDSEMLDAFEYSSNIISSIQEKPKRLSAWNNTKKSSNNKKPEWSKSAWVLRGGR